jgi:hypothetical protein
VGLPSKAEGPASEVYRIKDEPADALAARDGDGGKRGRRGSRPARRRPASAAARTPYGTCTPLQVQRPRQNRPPVPLAARGAWGCEGTADGPAHWEPQPPRGWDPGNLVLMGPATAGNRHPPRRRATAEMGPPPALMGPDTAGQSLPRTRFARARVPRPF